MAERNDRTRFRERDFRLMVALLLSAFVVGVAGSILSLPDRDLSRVFVAATITLVFGSLVGGAVSLLIAEFDRRRIQRAAQLEYISNILTELKGTYDRVDKGRTLIVAHRSAKTYGEQMREFIDARVKLLAVERALRFDERRSAIPEVSEDVTQMQQYLLSLIEEYALHYRDISGAQRIHEAEVAKALQQSPICVPDTNKPWDKLRDLPHLKDFIRPVDDASGNPIQEQSNYSRLFLQKLDDATEKLRRALESELSQ